VDKINSEQGNIPARYNVRNLFCRILFEPSIDQLIFVVASVGQTLSSLISAELGGSLGTLD
jgi:hypothetical protein